MPAAAALAAGTMLFGLKLTNTPVLATDDDQLYIRYVGGTDASWRLIWSVGGVDEDFLVAPAPTAEGFLHAVFEVDAAAKGRLYISTTRGRRPALVQKSSVSSKIITLSSTNVETAMTAAAALIPVAGIEQDSTTVTPFTVRSMQIARDVA